MFSSLGEVKSQALPQSGWRVPFRPNPAEDWADAGRESDTAVCHLCDSGLHQYICMCGHVFVRQRGDGLMEMICKVVCPVLSLFF